MIERYFPSCISGVFLFLLSFGVALAQPAKSGRQSEWEQVLTAARKEARVVVMGPPGADARQALTTGFQKAFPGIEVEYNGAAGAKTSPRILAERNAGQYLVDIHVGGTTTMLESLLPAGILDPIRPVLMLPEVVDAKKWWQGRLDFSDREGRYNVVFSTNVKTPIAINPEKVNKDSIRSYWDLLDPKWHGKIVMRDPTGAGPGLATATFWYADPRLGKEFMRKFFATKVVLAHDDRQMLEWIARGQYLIVAAPSELHATGLKAKGLSVDLMRAEQFKESSYLTAGFGSVALINRAPHPNAAKVYVNWLLTRDAQTDWSKSSGYLSRRLDVSRDHIEPALIPQDGISYQPNYKEEYVRLRDEVTTFIEGLLKR
ncbi:MAG: ABC transporter substrate-binding protein [Candidatus Binatia bacterium]